MKQPELTSILPFDNQQKELVDHLLQGFNDTQLTWLAGYLTGITLPHSLKTQTLPSPDTNLTIQDQVPQSAPVDELTVLYGTRTGNGLSVANHLKTLAEPKGIRLSLQDMNEYPLKRLTEEKNLLVIVSTHGEGDPPIAAEEFYNFIHSKRAPQLTDTNFSVLALGDRSYVHFCKTGKDIDQQLEKLGARRIFPRADCDLDFLPASTQWVDGVLDVLIREQPAGKTSVIQSTHGASPQSAFNKQHPFEASLLEKTKLNGRGSKKETFHYELSLENSGIQFQPGDALGVFPSNSARIVNELIETLALSEDKKTETGSQSATLEEALTRDFEISLLTPDVMMKYNAFAQSREIEAILNDPERLNQYLYGRDVIDLFKAFPVKLETKDLLNTLRKLQPRLYSIASSLNAYPEEVHLLVSTVRYTNERYKEGTCSTFLSDRLVEDEKVRVFVEANPEFRLPSDPDTPIIMVGPGTGVAPFRAFLQERQSLDAKGKNWLFSGDRNFKTDFLYQTELLSYHKKGILTNLNVAFSRDTDQKVYVQHKMLQHSRELFAWLEEGAHFYVCGDMKHMWHDVNQTLLKIIAKEGGLDKENAESYLRNLKKSKRYQVDVY